MMMLRLRFMVLSPPIEKHPCRDEPRRHRLIVLFLRSRGAMAGAVIHEGSDEARTLKLTMR
jgi:hypothetical protein